MAMVRYDQANFTAGELDPRTYARIDYSGYGKGCKRLRNCLVIPQGGFQKRFGTTYVDALAIAQNADQCEIWTLLYNDNITYVLLVQAESILVYFENIQIASISSVPFKSEDIPNLRVSQVQNDLVVVHPNYNPRVIKRTNNAANIITGITAGSNTVQVTTALTVGQILPVQFTSDGSLPTTSPQIYVDRTYFARVTAANDVQIYTTPDEALAQNNPYVMTALGSATNNLIVQNTWAISAITFDFMPAYDFNYAYQSLTFTPSATTGNGITLTASSGFFTDEMQKGLFSSGTQIMRFTTRSSDTVMNGDVLEAFHNTNAIKGDISTIGAPAWSNSRGWPRAVGFYQARLVLAGSASIPNGVWMSVINTPYDFDDSDAFADSGASYYTSSGVSNYVRSITSTESLVAHGNSGTYSTALGNTTPIVPENFFLIEQNKDGCSAIQPVHIDNQIIYIDSSNNNVKNLQYDIIQSKYLLNNISVASASVINHPTDMASYSDPEFTDGSYVFITNGDGSLAIFQTLIEQNIGAWSLSNTEMSATPAQFLHVASAVTRCWFITQRLVNGVQKLYLEELDFTVYTDCSKTITNNVSATITGLNYLEGETLLQVTADGNYIGNYTVTAGQITLPAVYGTISMGLPIYSLFEPLPVAFPLDNGPTLYKPKHIRGLYVNFYQTYGAKVNGVTIPNTDMRDFVLGQNPIPTNGVYLTAPMGDWDPFDPFAQVLTITSTQPYPMTIIGISYELEI